MPHPHLRPLSTTAHSMLPDEAVFQVSCLCFVAFVVDENGPRQFRWDIDERRMIGFYGAITEGRGELAALVKETYDSLKYWLGILARAPWIQGIEPAPEKENLTTREFREIGVWLATCIEVLHRFKRAMPGRTIRKVTLEEKTAHGDGNILELLVNPRDLDRTPEMAQTTLRRPPTVNGHVNGTNGYVNGINGHVNGVEREESVRDDHSEASRTP